MTDKDNSGIFLVSLHSKTLKLSKDQPITIGREKYNDIVLNDLLVSRRHAEIRWNGQNYIVKDLKSRNGTTVNGKACTSCNMFDGDELKVGGHQFRVRAANHTYV